MVDSSDDTKINDSGSIILLRAKGSGLLQKHLDMLPLASSVSRPPQASVLPYSPELWLTRASLCRVTTAMKTSQVLSAVTMRISPEP